MNLKIFRKRLLDEASEPFRVAGRFAYYYSRGKLGRDCIFSEMLRQGMLPSSGRFLDLGCGQGCLFSWLLAARKLYEQGQWLGDWPAPPQPTALHGIELMVRDVERAKLCFGAHHPLVDVRQGDMCSADFGSASVVTIFDALHYFDYARQREVLQRIYETLPTHGVFFTRVGDADGGLPYRFCNWVDHVVTFARGHRLPKLYCRTVRDWSALLREVGYFVDVMSMHEGTPFANTLIICKK